MTSEANIEEWYEFVTDEKLKQGEIIFQMPVLRPIWSPTPPFKTEAKVYDVIVLSQSCDLENNKLTDVLVTPVHSLESLPNILDRSYGSKEWAKIKESIRRGAQPNLHMLNAYSGSERQLEFSVVDFSHLYTIPRESIDMHILSNAERLRLKAPYRESLSQALGLYFMRVGLPAPIPPFRK